MKCPCVGGLPCPLCGEHAFFTVNLGNLDGEKGTGAFCCGECQDEFSFALVASLVNQWSRILEWVADAPRMED